MSNGLGKARGNLAAEVARLQERLQEAESTLAAISSHGVDAFLVRPGSEEKVLVLDGVDRPYRLLIERMQQAAVTVTPDGTILYANARLSEMLCVPHSSVPGSRLADYVVPEEWALLSRLLELGQRSEVEEELRLICSEDTRPVHVTVSLLSEPGRLLCLIITDLTHQKRHEIERQRIVSENAAAQAAAAVLRETNRRKDEFLAMLAHELRGPLAPLRNGLEILGRLVGPDPQVREVREMMQRQTHNLVRLVEDLLDAARVTQGKITLKRERADLREVVERAAESCRGAAEERGQRLDVRLPEEGPVWGIFDDVRLSQVVVNLLSNAIKFTPEGGSIALALERISEAEAAIRVRDTGIGIDPAVLPTIFELFSQASATISRSEGGLGIGLTLARRLVEMHGGQLTASSAGLGHGSEFVVRLPVGEATGLLSDESGWVQGAKPRGPRVLVVDDNPDAAASMALLVSVMGHEVRQAYSGEAVFQTLSAFRPDLMLLDIGLPGMDGYAVAGRLRANPAWRDIKLVAVSGYGSEEHRQRARQAGFDEHLVKPVDMTRLQQLLNSLI